MRSAGVTRTNDQQLLVDLIVRARALSGWTQQRLAEEAHVSIGTVRKLCSGHTPEPGFFIVRKVVAASLTAVSDIDVEAGERLRAEYIRLALGD